MLKKANSSQVIGRLAPSPTGYLHLGNTWAFLCAWLGARKADGQLIMRIEDIDPQRSRAEYVTALIDDLHWLGLDWDYGPGCSNPYALPSAEMFLQSKRTVSYLDGIAKLKAAGLVYPCFCSRKKLRSLAGAPQSAGDYAEYVYNGKCSQLSAQEKEQKLADAVKYTLRVNFSHNMCADFLHFTDLVHGEVRFNLAVAGGDFAVQRSDGVFAYQLAVVLDDIAMGVNQIVRGADILNSVPRQKFLYNVLGGTLPEFAHIPLMLDHEGERLAKRHQSLSLRSLREQGVKAENLLGFIAHWGGLIPEFKPSTAQGLLASFAWSKIQQHPENLPENIAALLTSL